MKKNRQRNLVFVFLFVALPVIAIEYVMISLAFDQSSAANNSNEVRREVGNGPVGQVVVADFTDNWRGLYLRTLPHSSTHSFSQIGLGWPLNAQPTDSACAEEPGVPGCQPLVTATTVFDQCRNSSSDYKVVFSANTVKNKPPTEYILERKIGSNWHEEYRGAAAETDVTMSENTQFRAAGANAYGVGEFSSPFTVQNICPITAQIPYLDVFVFNCQGNNSWEDASWTGSFTDPTDYFEVQRAALGSSNWSTIYSGSQPDSCSMVGFNIGSQYRARVVSTVNTSSNWVYVYVGNECGGW